MTPFMLRLTRRFGLAPIPYLLAVALASNIGSAATITGNPQNVLIGSMSRISYLVFVAHLGPIAVAGLFLTWAVLHRLFWGIREARAVVWIGKALDHCSKQHHGRHVSDDVAEDRGCRHENRDAKQVPGRDRLQQGRRQPGAFRPTHDDEEADGRTRASLTVSALAAGSMWLWLMHSHDRRGERQCVLTLPSGPPAAAKDGTQTR
jgi:hypothetical protein